MAAPKIPYEPIVLFWNTRSEREKNMLLVLVFLAFLFIDYSLFIRPVQGFYAHTLPRLGEVKQELRGLKDDKKNQALIQTSWETAQTKLAESEKKFIHWDQISFLIQHISEVASSSGVKIVAIQPSDISQGSAAKVSYLPAPVELSALAGTHELGRFLEKLETGPLFLKVTNLEIKENPLDLRKHSVSLKVQAYRKSA